MPKIKQKVVNSSQVKVKKPFDKAKWREKQYSKKFKVEQWEERRKKNLLHQLHKDLRKDNPNYQRPKFARNEKDETGSGPASSAYHHALQEFERKKADAEDKKKEVERQNAERKEALNRYKIKKAERFKRLNKKTRKGQPVMKDRMELLLEKIQSQS